MHLTTTVPEFNRTPLYSARLATAAIVCGLAAVFALDRGTGSTPVQHLYYLPIILAGATFELVGGGLAALAAIVLYHVANPHLLTFAYAESDVVQIVLFLLVGLGTAKLTRDANRLRRLAATDDLTGLHNLRSFEAQLVGLVRESREQRMPIAMLVLDVDRLKSLNDVHGHLTGADAVRTVGRILAERLPPRAVACRYGGDEFAIVIPGCPPTEARRIADEVRRAVHEFAPTLAGRAFAAGTLSLSIGACCAPLDGDGGSHAGALPDADSGEVLFREADGALYRAKAGGRNRVIVCDRERPASSVEVPDPAARQHGVAAHLQVRW